MKKSVPEAVALSYEDFLQKDVGCHDRANVGLQALYRSVFPAKDEQGNAELDFVSYAIGDPGCTAAECLENGETYSAPIMLTLQLVTYDPAPDPEDRRPKDIKEQEVYFGEIPLMTEAGFFVVDGCEQALVIEGSDMETAGTVLRDLYCEGLIRAKRKMATRLCRMNLESVFPQEVVSHEETSRAVHQFLAPGVVAASLAVQVDSDAVETRAGRRAHRRGAAERSVGRAQARDGRHGGEWMDHLMCSVFGVLECVDAIERFDDGLDAPPEIIEEFYRHIERLKGCLATKGMSRH